MKKNLQHFMIVFFVLMNLVSLKINAQTVTPTASQCVNTGKVVIDGVIGNAPYIVTVASTNPDYDPVSAGGNRISLQPDSPDVFDGLYAGNYTFTYKDPSGNEQVFTATITSTYVVPGNSDYLPIATAPTTCINGTDATISGVMTNGLAPYKYTIIAGPNNIGLTNTTGNFTGLTGGVNYTITAEDFCNNVQTRIVTTPNYTFSVSAAQIKSTSCSAFELTGITVSPFPPGGSYEIVYNGNVLGTGTSLPVVFSGTTISEVNAGQIAIRVKDACGNYISTQSTPITNDWAFTGATTAIDCANDQYLINSLTTTGFIPTPITYNVQYGDGPVIPFNGANLPFGTASGMPPHGIGAGGVDFNIEIIDGCGVKKTYYFDYRIYLDAPATYDNCNTTTINTAYAAGSGSASLPVTYTISPDPNAAGTNTTGTFANLPDGSYTITAVDACGRTRAITKEVSHAWTADGYDSYTCILDKVIQLIRTPHRAISPVTIQQFDGPTATGPVLSTQIVNTSGAGNPNAGPGDIANWSEFVVNPNDVRTYLITDACGRSTTFTLTAPAEGAGPIGHAALEVDKCINKGDISMSFVKNTNLNNIPNYKGVVVQLYEINTPGTLIFNQTFYGNQTNYMLATDQPVGTYVIKYFFEYCPDGAVYTDIVTVNPYVQPKLGVGLYFSCNNPVAPTSQIAVSASSGVAPYTYEVIGSIPAGFTAPAQSSQTFTVPNIYKSVTVRVIDACLNGTTKTLPLIPQPLPAIKSAGGPADPCNLPFSGSLYVDATIYGAFSGTTYEWRKLTGPGADPNTVIGTSASLPYTLPNGEGKYSLNIQILGSCYNQTKTVIVLPAGICDPNAPILNAIGNYVWFDSNNDGTQDVSEVGIAGVTVTLFDGTGKIVATTTTDAYGKYLFSSLPDGSYQVGFTAPANYAFTASNMPGDNANNGNSDASPMTGMTGIFQLAGGETDLTADAGFYIPQPVTASLGDYVWLDTNKDGIQNSGEVGISGVTVTLYDSGNNPIATTVTDATGHYQFSDLVPATYSVGFTPPAGYILSPKDATGAASNVNGAADFMDSDANPTTGLTAPVTLVAGENNPGLDAGLYPQDPLKGSLGNFVWYDTNNNGIQDIGEAGVPGVTVNLLNAAGTVIGTTVTNELGQYIFNNLDAGTYGVQFVTSTLPAGFTFSTQNAGNDALDSDPNATGLVTGISLAAGQKDLSIDAGIYNATTPLLNGLGDYVWYDTNRDGIQGAAEAPVPGVTVTLFNASGATIGTTTTDATGHYSFNNLPDGTYSVGFSNLPVGYTFTTSNVGGDATDSDVAANGTTATVSLAGGQYNPTLDAGIVAGTNNNSTASLGDKVWYDNPTAGAGSVLGVQDPTEAGVAGVTVTLYGPDGTTVIATTTTDPLGNYLFTNLPSGDYIVGFSNLPAGYTFTQANTGTDPALDANADASTGGKTSIIHLNTGEENLTIDAGILSAPNLASLGNYVWIDSNGDGLQNPTESGIPGVTVKLYAADGTTVLAVTTTDANGFYQFTGLAPGTYSVGFSNLPAGYVFAEQDATGASTNALSGDNNDSDANGLTGLTPPVTLVAGQNYPDLDAGVTTNQASLGNYVWVDANKDGIQDPTEKGVPGVTVNLYDATTGNLVASAVTDAYGHYFFPNLNPGEYQLGFTNIPDGNVFTQQGAGTNDGVDSNVNPATGYTDVIVLGVGENNLTIDAGIHPESTAGLGNYVWADYNKDGLQTMGEPGVAGVTVLLYDNATGTLLQSAITDGTGFYSFPNLPASTYFLRFTTLPVDVNGVPATFTTKDVTGQMDNTNGTVDYMDSDVLGSGYTSVITLMPNEYNPGIDAGIILATANLGDRVWLDTNKDGIQDSGEVGVKGVLVTLYASDGTTVIATTTTDANGNYLFDNLMPGSYVVGITPPTGYSGSPLSGTSDQALDSNFDPTTFKTTPIALAAGDNNMTVDAGIFVSSTLSVTLLNFDGKRVNKNVVLNWKTTNEQDFSHFELQRSESLNEFSTLATVKGTKSAFYSHIDSNPLNGTSYYRLKMVDLDGTTTISKIISVKFDKDNSFVMVENPATNGEFKVITNLVNPKFTLLSGLGTSVGMTVNDNGNNTYTIKVNNTALGIYYLNIVSEGRVATNKVYIP